MDQIEDIHVHFHPAVILSHQNEMITNFFKFIVYTPKKSKSLANLI